MATGRRHVVAPFMHKPIAQLHLSHLFDALINQLATLIKQLNKVARSV